MHLGNLVAYFNDLLSKCADQTAYFVDSPWHILNHSIAHAGSWVMWAAFCNHGVDAVCANWAGTALSRHWCALYSLIWIITICNFHISYPRAQMESKPIFTRVAFVPARTWTWNSFLISLRSGHKNLVVSHPLLPSNPHHTHIHINEMNKEVKE